MENSSNSDDIGNDSILCTPPELRLLAQQTINNLLPDKSADRYLKDYDKFNSWRVENQANSSSETVILAYLTYLHKTKTYAPTTMWSIFSKLTKIIQIKENTDISQCKQALAFLKKVNIGHTPKQSSMLAPEHVQKFFDEAPDKDYLLEKVILALGISGGLRREEIHNITVNDIQKFEENMVQITISNNKSNQPKSFAMTEDMYNVYKKYAKLRPLKISSKSFLIKYEKGKCGRQNIGINRIGNTPAIIAEFLKLDNPKSYTGHCLRRTGTTLLVTSGADMGTVKRYGAWKSESCVDRYVAENFNNKRKVNERIIDTLNVFKKPRIETVTSTSADTVNNNSDVSVHSVESNVNPTNFEGSVSNLNDSLPMQTEVMTKSLVESMQTDPLVINPVVLPQTNSIITNPVVSIDSNLSRNCSTTNQSILSRNSSSKVFADYLSRLHDTNSSVSTLDHSLDPTTFANRGWINHSSNSFNRCDNTYKYRLLFLYLITNFSIISHASDLSGNIQYCQSTWHKHLE